mgnify:FL=1
MKKNAVYTALLAIAALLIIIAVLFTSLQICINQRNWYYESYVKYGTAKETQMSNEDMTEAIFRLVDYMEGRVDSIQLSVTEAGRVVEMYNRQEIDHMVDVRALYQAWRAVRTYGGILAAIIIAVCMLTLPKGQRIGMLCRGFLIAAAVFGAVLIVLGIWVAVDFNSFWTEFHHLFFTNDLWLMDYRTCRMIRICPLQLFNDIVVRFALMFLVPFALMLALAVWGRKRSKQK